MRRYRKVRMSDLKEVMKGVRLQQVTANKNKMMKKYSRNIEINFEIDSFLLN
jgi:hypothetical protein